MPHQVERMQEVKWEAYCQTLLPAVRLRNKLTTKSLCTFVFLAAEQITPYRVIEKIKWENTCVKHKLGNHLKHFPQRKYRTKHEKMQYKWKPQWDTTWQTPGWQSSKSLTLTSVGKNVEKTEPSHIGGENVRCSAAMENSLAVSKS